MTVTESDGAGGGIESPPVGLADFLLARTAEDQRNYEVIVAEMALADPPVPFIDLATRVLAECEAKRRIVSAHAKPMIRFGGVEVVGLLDALSGRGLRRPPRLPRRVEAVSVARKLVRWFQGVSISIPATRRHRAAALADARQIYGLDLTDDQRAGRWRAAANDSIQRGIDDAVAGRTRERPDLLEGGTGKP